MQNIFSAQAAVIKGGAIDLTPNSSELSAPNGTKFSIKKYGKLYYFNYTNPSSRAYSAEVWHKILGHCNMNDVFKLENAVEGMKLAQRVGLNVARVCAREMSQYREPDRHTFSPVQLVHSDLAGPITPKSKDGHKYAMVFVDDY